MTLSPVEAEILRSLLLRGDLLPVEIAEDHDRHPSSVSRSMSNLEDDGLTAHKGRGVWELTAEGVGEARRIIRIEADRRD